MGRSLKEVDISQGLDNLIDQHTSTWGLRGRYPNGTFKVFEKFKSHFEAEFWQVNVVNPTALDSKGKRLKGSLIVEIQKES